MKRYLFDSNALNAFVNHHDPFIHRARATRQRGGHLGTCEPVIAELYYGLEFSTSRDANVVLLEHALGGIRCWPTDGPLANMGELLVK